MRSILNTYIKTGISWIKLGRGSIPTVFIIFFFSYQFPVASCIHQARPAGSCFMYAIKLAYHKLSPFRSECKRFCCQVLNSLRKGCIHTWGVVIDDCVSFIQLLTTLLMC